jgi:hypothetical protein
MRAIVERILEEIEAKNKEHFFPYEYYQGAKWALEYVLSDLDKNDEEMMMDMMLNDLTQYENDYDEIDLHEQLAKEEYERWIKEDSEKLNALRKKMANQ